MAGYLLLALSLIAAGLALNANFPIRRSAPLILPSFIAGWLTSELALQLLALELLLGLALSVEGALRDWPGLLGLVILLASAAGTFRLWRTARSAANPLDDAFAHFGSLPPLPSASPLPASRVFYPFVRSDRAVQRHGDLRYAEGAGRRHLLDVYVPAAGARRAPVLLQIHGGGWFTGHKRQQAMPLLLHMARCGWVCVSINYRLSPRATFPDHLIDAKLALRWIREHIAEFGGDPDYVVVTGGSAGGHLAALLALTPNVPEYQPGFEQVDTSVRACIPLYGVYDLSDRLRHQRHAGLRMLIARFVLKKNFASEPDAFDRASPLAHVGHHAPPFFVIHGTHDNMASVEDARELVARLRAESPGPVLYAEIPGAHHAFEIFHSARTDMVVLAIARFLQALHARHLAELGEPAAAANAAAAAESTAEGTTPALTG